MSLRVCPRLCSTGLSDRRPTARAFSWVWPRQAAPQCRRFAELNQNEIFFVSRNMVLCFADRLDGPTNGRNGCQTFVAFPVCPHKVCSPWVALLYLQHGIFFYFVLPQWSLTLQGKTELEAVNRACMPYLRKQSNINCTTIICIGIRMYVYEFICVVVASDPNNNVILLRYDKSHGAGCHPILPLSNT